MEPTLARLGRSTCKALPDDEAETEGRLLGHAQGLLRPELSISEAFAAHCRGVR